MPKNPTDLPIHQELALVVPKIAKPIGRALVSLLKMAVTGIAYWGFTMALVYLLGLALPSAVALIIGLVIEAILMVLVVAVAWQRESRRSDAAHVKAMRDIYGDNVAGFDQWLAARKTKSPVA